MIGCILQGRGLCTSLLTCKRILDRSILPMLPQTPEPRIGCAPGASWLYMAFFLCLERKSVTHIARPLPAKRSAPATLKPLPAFAHLERVRNSSPRAVTVRYIWAIVNLLGFAAFLIIESFIKNGLKTSGIILSLIRK